jgi:hypothetical protein
MRTIALALVGELCILWLSDLLYPYRLLGGTGCFIVGLNAEVVRADGL